MQKKVADWLLERWHVLAAATILSIYILIALYVFTPTIVYRDILTQTDGIILSPNPPAGHQQEATTNMPPARYDGNGDQDVAEQIDNEAASNQSVSSQDTGTQQNTASSQLTSVGDPPILNSTIPLPDDTLSQAASRSFIQIRTLDQAISDAKALTNWWPWVTKLPRASLDILFAGTAALLGALTPLLDKFLKTRELTAPEPLRVYALRPLFGFIMGIFVLLVCKAIPSFLLTQTMTNVSETASPGDVLQFHPYTIGLLALWGGLYTDKLLEKLGNVFS